MKHELPPLPFAKNALEPHMSSETFDYHYGKHHKAYVDKLNALIPGTEFENMALEDIIKKASGPIFNNAAQTWNHTFFWNCLTPNTRAPQGELLDAIKRDFGSISDFNKKFAEAASGVFGSGWAWLVINRDGKLAIETTPNGNTPIRENKVPLLTCDVWEHAYYIDYRNDRAKYLNAVFSILNWEFAERNFKSGRAAAA